jgi:hypothetical protein
MAVSVTPEQLTIAGSASEPDASTLPQCRPRGLGRRTSSGQPRHALDPTGFPPRSATPRTCRQSGSDQGGIPCSHSAMLSTVPAGLLVLFAHLVRSSRLGRCSLRSTTGIRPKCCQTRHYLEREKNVCGGVPAFNHREIDVEFSKWGNGQVTNTGSWTVQPWQTAGNTKTLSPARCLALDALLHLASGLRQLPQLAPGEPVDVLGARRPQFRRREDASEPVALRGQGPTNGKAAEVIVKSFTFTPLDQQTDWAPVSPAQVGG